MLTPVAAIMMLAQPSSYVKAAPPARIEKDETCKQVFDDGEVYIYSLAKYCDAAGWKDLNALEQQLERLKGSIDGYLGNIKVMWNEGTKKCIFSHANAFFGTVEGTEAPEGWSGNILVSITPEEFVALENELDNPEDVLNLTEDASDEQKEFVNEVSKIKDDLKKAKETEEEAKKKAEEAARPEVKAEAVGPKEVEAEKEKPVVIGAPDVKKEKDEKANNRALNMFKWMGIVGAGGVITKVIYNSVTGEVIDEYEVDEDGNPIYSKTEEVNQNYEGYENDEESYEEAEEYD